MTIWLASVGFLLDSVFVWNESNYCVILERNYQIPLVTLKFVQASNQYWSHDVADNIKNLKNKRALECTEYKLLEIKELNLKTTRVVRIFKIQQRLDSLPKQYDKIQHFKPRHLVGSNSINEKLFLETSNLILYCFGIVSGILMFWATCAGQILKFGKDYAHSLINDN